MYELQYPLDEQDRLARLDDFVMRSKTAVFVREIDQLLMIRPDKTMQLNASGVAILKAFYNRGEPAQRALSALSEQLAVERNRLLHDIEQLFDTLRAILNEDFSSRKNLRFTHFDRSAIRYPTLAEIALTYACNAACKFCYAAAGQQRAKQVQAMSTAQVKLVMDKIYHQAHVPSLSFTGGEATLRADLPELIAHGKALGMRVNLISNGLRSASESYVKQLIAAGLDSTQISLEAADAELHDAIVAVPGAFARTVSAVRNFQQAGIHVHTNTTLCQANIDVADDLIRFLAGELGQRTMSMNLLIPTGAAGSDEGLGVSYRRLAERLPGLIAAAKTAGIRLVWYSPVPYCIFNPVLHDLGAKSCACIDGILSVGPDGQVLPCSSFEDGIGSLLERSFEEIYRSKAARYWREKRFVPPLCRECRNVDVCAGACPLYWDARGNFAELPGGGKVSPQQLRRWHRRRKQGASFGVSSTPGQTNG
ncbi:MAG: radical SAM protein [Deltaproteobacteria bacterium]|nr:radical SAM protein [Deltaproteobacteria bacterium]